MTFYSFICLITISFLADKIVAVNNTSGVIRLISELDADEIIFSVFRVTCTVGKKDFMMVGNVSVVDVNDNAPTTDKGESTKRIIKHVKPVSSFDLLHLRA